MQGDDPESGVSAHDHYIAVIQLMEDVSGAKTRY
jgi:hypothetical protein